MSFVCINHFNRLADLLAEVLTPAEINVWMRADNLRLHGHKPCDVLCVYPDAVLAVARRDLKRLMLQSQITRTDTAAVS